MPTESYLGVSFLIRWACLVAVDKVWTGVGEEDGMNYRRGSGCSWPLFNFFFFCFQGAIPPGLSHWCPCYGSVLGPTSSPTACPLQLSAVLLRPWICSWRVMPSSNLWLPRPGGIVTTGVDQREGEMVATHLSASSCLPPFLPTLSARASSFSL